MNIPSGKKNNSPFLIILISTYALFSQSHVDYNFTYQLIKLGKLEQAIYYLRKFPHSFSEDSLNFLIGYNYYLMKKPDSAYYYLNKPSQNFHAYFLSRTLASVNANYAKKPYHALQTINSISPSDDDFQSQYKYLLQAGTYLLIKDIHKFDSVSVYFKYDNLNYEAEQKNLIEIKKRILKLKQKSPWIAGALSALIPGLGKFYAGQKGAALSTFTSNVIFAGMAIETFYRTQNLKSPSFILFTSLFTFFYTGNIIGSIHSVKKRYKSLSKQIDNEILINMHIPVARLIE